MGNYLADRRKALGLTQKEIAELVDVSEATVSRWKAVKLLICGVTALQLTRRH